MKIMIVDDSTFMRNMLKNTLKDSGHEIVEASNADEAVNMFKETKPHLIFMDVVLGGKTGIDALKEIKAIDASANVIMCTSVGGQQQIVDEAVNAGAKDFIVKPFRPEDIKSAVSHFEQA